MSAFPPPPVGFDEDEDVHDDPNAPKVDARTIAPAGFFDDDFTDDLLESLPTTSTSGTPRQLRPSVYAFHEDPDFQFITSKKMANPVQYEELRRFLMAKDPQLCKNMNPDKVLVMFKQEDVANAIFEKYKSLPTNWKTAAISETTAETISDKKINEILDSEYRFVTTITELKNRFLDRVYEILGNEKQKANLGLTLDETNQIFEQLPGICRFSQQLLNKLEIINLVRTQPITGEGRAIHVGQAFVDMASKLHVYAPAITSYQQSLDILTRATSKLEKQKKKSKVNFLSLWEEVTSKNPVLKGQQLQAVLVTPMQRIPRYKMLLEQLAKDCDHPDAEKVVNKALELFSSAAKNINEAMRSHEKLVGFFGAGTSELKPMSSSGGTGKEGEVKVINTYTNKFLGT